MPDAPSDQVERHAGKSAFQERWQRAAVAARLPLLYQFQVGGRRLAVAAGLQIIVDLVALVKTIEASALNSGTGGRVIIWSDDYTRFFGTVSARGPPGGIGGFVETSGTYLTVGLSAHVDAGMTGVWLLDPHNITVDGKSSGNATTDALTHAELSVQELLVAALRAADPVLRSCRLGGEETTGDVAHFTTETRFPILNHSTNPTNP